MKYFIRSKLSYLYFKLWSSLVATPTNPRRLNITWRTRTNQISIGYNTLSKYSKHISMGNLIFASGAHICSIPCCPFWRGSKGGATKTKTKNWFNLDLLFIDSQGSEAYLFIHEFVIRVCSRRQIRRHVHLQKKGHVRLSFYLLTYFDRYR